MVYFVMEFNGNKRTALTSELRSIRRAIKLRDYYRERRNGRVYVKRVRV